MSVKIIAAASYNGVIGSFNNSLPWGHDYPEDLKFFRQQTINQTTIMGRKTYDSIGKPLKNRRNIILTHRIVPRLDIEGAEVYHSLEKALDVCEYNAWIIGGSHIYQAALQYASELFITSIPKIITGDDLVYFPYVNPNMFELQEQIELNTEKNLFCNRFIRKS